MRPSAPTFSGMPTKKGYIGWWGEMGGAKQKGITQYSVSPYKQRPFAGVFRSYIFNGFSRLIAQVPYWGIPVGLAYASYTWGKTTYEYNNSKEGHHKLSLEEGH